MYTQAKFSVPYTKGILDALEKLDTNSIHDVYFSDNKFGSARSIFNGNEMFDEIYAVREKYGIKAHYLVNPSVYSNDFYQKVPELIEHIADIDADIVTLNNTYLLRAGIINDFKKSKPDIELKNSVNNLVRTLKDFQFMYEELGLTHVIVDRSLNRDLDTLRKMKTYADKHDIKITMLVNEGCIVDCKWKQWDDLIISQTNDGDDRKLTDKIYIELGCVNHFKQKPGEWLKTAFTLPNDIDKFNGLVDIVKLAGRGFPIDQWTRMIDAYQKQSGNIRLIDILSTKGNDFLANTLVNQLSALGFNELTNNCKSICGDECNHCDKIYDKLIRIQA